MPTTGATETPAAPVRVVTPVPEAPAAEAEPDALADPLWIVTPLGSWPSVKLEPHVLETAEAADDEAEALTPFASGASSVSESSEASKRPSDAQTACPHAVQRALALNELKPPPERRLRRLLTVNVVPVDDCTALSRFVTLCMVSRRAVQLETDQ